MYGGRKAVCLKQKAGGEDYPAKIHAVLFSPRQHLVLSNST